MNQLDLFASLADLAGAKGASALRPDSQDLLPALLDAGKEARVSLVEQSGRRLALREGSWKYIAAGAEPKRKVLEEGDITQGPPAGPEEQLYDLAHDPGETHNVAVDHPDVVQKMKSELAAIRGADVPPE
jgi:arylsulfatase A-like enzyme